MTAVLLLVFTGLWIAWWPRSAVPAALPSAVERGPAAAATLDAAPIETVRPDAAQRAEPDQAAVPVPPVDPATNTRSVRGTITVE